MKKKPVVFLDKNRLLAIIDELQVAAFNKNYPEFINVREKLNVALEDDTDFISLVEKIKQEFPGKNS